MLCHLILDWDGLQLDVGHCNAFNEETRTDVRAG